MSTAGRLRALSFAIEQQARTLRAYADQLARGDVPDRGVCARIAGVVASLAHDAGEIAGLTGQASSPMPEELTDRLIHDIEDGRPPDPPGRITPQERPPTKTRAKPF